MSTQVKMHTRYGAEGEILHQHGNSAWHVANQTHTIKVGRPDRDNDEESHAEHAALQPASWGNLPADQRNRYRHLVRTGEFQQPWHDLYYQKLADKRRAGQVKGEPTEVVVDELEFA